MDKDEAAIRSLVDEWLDATRRGDIDTLSILRKNDHNGIF